MAVIDAVLFDFGGVFTQSPFDAIEALGNEMGAPKGRLLEIVFGPYDEDTDHPWHRVERGELGLAEARQQIIDLGKPEGLDTDLLKLFVRMGNAPGVREDFVSAARNARGAGMRTALVTNNAAEFRERWRQMIPVDELFELVIDSSEVGVRKPDPRIYHMTLEQLGGIAPERAVFLDDHQGNVRAAQALGLHGIVVEPDGAPALLALAALLRGAR